MNQHSEYHYSVSVITDDLAVLHCLRALSQYAQVTGNTRIPWSGTKEEDWRRNNHCVTFHFSKPLYRDTFLMTASRLLPKESWKKVGESDSDPASPQSK